MVSSRVEVGRLRLWLACLFAPLALAAVAAPTIAKADGTVWICKPGQADDLCAGTINGISNPPPGQSSQPLPYTRPADAPVDCFYLYPTQSEQAGPNSDLAKDPPIQRVVVQQARMFSSVCKVYAPMYNQVTLNGDQTSYNASVETAYQSAKAAFEDFLASYNGDRGFIMIGHSQGSAHTARLIHDVVDPNPELRKRFVGAIAPGANIAVPIDKAVGGYFQNVPACTAVGEYGCVTAFSTYNDVPGPNAEFSRLNVGYWIYPQARFDSSQYEAMCVNPALLDGGGGTLLPLVDFDYLFSTPAQESAAPWQSQPDYYKAECKRQDGAHWLNLSKTNLAGDARPDLGAAVASGSNYHVPEVNLAEGNLLTIAQKQTDSYEAEVARIAALQAKLKTLNGKVAKAKRKIASGQKSLKRIARKFHASDSPKQWRVLRHKRNAVVKQIKAQRRQIAKLRKQIAAVKKQLA